MARDSPQDSPYGLQIHAPATGIFISPLASGLPPSAMPLTLLLLPLLAAVS
jgi:hypothetical protein